MDHRCGRGRRKTGNWRGIVSDPVWPHRRNHRLANIHADAVVHRSTWILSIADDGHRGLHVVGGGGRRSTRGLCSAPVVDDHRIGGSDAEAELNILTGVTGPI